MLSHIKENSNKINDVNNRLAYEIADIRRMLSVTKENIPTSSESRQGSRPTSPLHDQHHTSASPQRTDLLSPSSIIPVTMPIPLESSLSSSDLSVSNFDFNLHDDNASLNG